MTFVPALIAGSVALATIDTVGFFHGIILGVAVGVALLYLKDTG